MFAWEGEWNPHQPLFWKTLCASHAWNLHAINSTLVESLRPLREDILSCICCTCLRVTWAQHLFPCKHRISLDGKERRKEEQKSLSRGFMRGRCRGVRYAMKMTQEVSQLSIQLAYNKEGLNGIKPGLPWPGVQHRRLSCCFARWGPRKRARTQRMPPDARESSAQAAKFGWQLEDICWQCQLYPCKPITSSGNLWAQLLLEQHMWVEGMLSKSRQVTSSMRWSCSAQGNCICACLLQHSAEKLVRISQTLKYVDRALRRATQTSHTHVHRH